MSESPTGPSPHRLAGVTYPMYYGKFGKFPFGKGFFKAPIGVVAGTYDRLIGPGFAFFPPGGFI